MGPAVGQPLDEKLKLDREFSIGLDKKIWLKELVERMKN